MSQLETRATAAGAPPNGESTIDINRVLTRLRAVMDQEDVLNEKLSALSKEKIVLRAQALDYHSQTGLASVANELIGVSFKADLRARVDPEKWTALHRWAVDTGNTHIFHRRLTDNKVIELLNAGVPLPEGLTLEGYTNMNIRRKGAASQPAPAAA